ncbi:MAG: hypothetical protein JWN93_2034 [Hyphomicrobiales bacterium]|jgi:Flp pilus assembly secretin CpaC|nr:hypothetical protein [Hyphomicrobiales bacterium]
MRARAALSAFAILFAAGVARSADLDANLPPRERPALELEPAYVVRAAIELKPGLTRIVQPGRSVQTVLMSDSRIADATLLTTNVVAVTGKSLGAANLILLDDQGAEISNTPVQVVAGADLRAGPVAPLRRQVRVRGFGGPGPEQDRSFLCANGCAPMPLLPLPPLPEPVAR